MCHENWVLGFSVYVKAQFELNKTVFTAYWYHDFFQSYGTSNIYIFTESDNRIWQLINMQMRCVTSLTDWFLIRCLNMTKWSFLCSHLVTNTHQKYCSVGIVSECMPILVAMATNRLIWALATWLLRLILTSKHEMKVWNQHK